MTSPTLTGPCAPWPLDETCLPDGWDPDALTPAQSDALLRATEILWGLSQGRFGLCEITLRPCRKKCAFGVPPWGGWTQYGQLVPYVNGGIWYNFGCGCRDSCGCKPLCAVELPGPVNRIVEVRMDGAVVPPSTYFVHNAKTLVRVEGQACWPDCQHLDRPLTEDGTFGITYERGIPVPAAGKYAVTKYAIELWKACTGVSGCRLPERVTSVTREGISMSMLDPMDFLDAGRTGLREVDMWLATVNPTGRRDVSRVYSPDRPRWMRTTS